MTSTRRAVVLVDAEHHPPVIRRALAEMAESGTVAELALVVGGSEKVTTPGEAPDLEIPTRWPTRLDDELTDAAGALQPDVIVDLSGSPALSEQRRLQLVAVALAAGCAYEAPGVRYEAPLPSLSSRPTVSIVAIGKRAGKTALSGALVRHGQGRGRKPVVVAMGRGGPSSPVVLPSSEQIDLARLLEVADAGGHAASDFYEDAVMTGAPTVGCWRAGDGPAGALGPSNLSAAIAAAEELAGDLTILEGSGAAIPACRADAVLLVVPATADPAALGLGVPLRFLLADLVVLTLCHAVGVDEVAAVLGAVRRLLPRRDLPIVLTSFRPYPLEPISGREVFFATTAERRAGPRLVRELEERWGARVVAVSHELANRPALAEDLRRAPPHDVVVTELKAAAVDLLARAAINAGKEVVFCDYLPEVVPPPPGLPPAGLELDLATAFDGLLDLADQRHAARQA
ncbi:MAG: hypothetical protein ABR592_07805 [Nitriliruptorales bacterium]